MKKPARPKPKTLPEDASHVAVLLRRLPTADERLKLVQGIETKARAQVEAAAANLAKAAGSRLTKARSAKLAELAVLHQQVIAADDDDLAVLYLQKDQLPPTLAAHVDLLRACLAAREGGEPRDFADWIMLAMSRADPLIEKGAKFKPRGGRPGKMAKLIKSEIAALRDMAASDAWKYLGDLPETSRLKIEFGATDAWVPGTGNVGFRRFSNLLSAAKKNAE